MAQAPKPVPDAPPRRKLGYSPIVEERRRQVRIEQWLPIEVLGAHPALAVAHDVSKNGLLMLSSASFAINEHLTLTFLYPRTRDIFSVTGKVVRVGLNQADPEGLWRYSIAVEFDEPREDLERLVAEVAAEEAG